MTKQAFRIPDQAMAQHMAILGKTGSGKTYAAKGLVERLIEAGRRVCVLDPTDAWWGLRSGTDGVRPGLPVVIFGGDHADVPITEHAGAAMGELIAGSDFPSIISLANTTLGERHRFVERFAESLFRCNKRPLYLVIDEADEFAPQSGPPGTERMLGAIDRIVRRGRIKGFRVMMITQRPAVLNKNVLTQANTLVAMRLPSSQDRAAVEAWVKGQADESQAKDMIKSLASLQRGEGWVWAPEINVLERTKFPTISTFDSSRTPDDGEPVKSVEVMRAVDVAGITKAMADAIEAAKDNDPDELKKQIKELRKQLQDERLKPIDMHAGDVGRLQDEIAELTHINREHEKYLRVFAERCDFYSLEIEKCIEGLASLDNACLHKFPRPPLSPYTPREASESRATQAPERPPTTHKALAARSAPAVAPPQDRPAAGNIGNDRDLEKGPGLILDAVAWWHMLGIETPTRAQVAAVAGYAVTGGSFQKYVSTLSSKKLIQLSPGAMSITDEGGEIAAWPDATPSRRSLHDRVLGILDSGPRKILSVLLEHGTEPMGRTQLGELSGFKATGGTFQKYLSTLSSLGLVTYPKKTTAASAPWLFDSWIGGKRS